MRALERVADKALQLGEAALCSYRSHSSSQCKNAALLHYAVRLWSVVQDPWSPPHMKSAPFHNYHTLVISTTQERYMGCQMPEIVERGLLVYYRVIAIVNQSLIGHKTNP